MRDRKTIIVTGAAKGLGLAISQRLLDEGFRVVGIGREKTKEFNSLCSQYSSQVSFIEFDVSDFEKIQDLVNSVYNENGEIYGLVNNAGIGLDGLLATMHETEIFRVLNVNLTAAILLSKYVCRYQLSAGEGRIISISSIIANTGFRGLSVYGATKAGLEGFSRSLSRDLGKKGITVNCVAPGFMDTAMTSGLEGDKLKSIKRRSPLGLPRVEDVAGMVAFLAGKDGEMLTGTVLTVDGGTTA